MVKECGVNVGFHSNIGTFRQSGHSKTPLGLLIINKIPFNPTYELYGRLIDRDFSPWRNVHEGYRSMPTTFSFPNEHLARRRELTCPQCIEI